MEVLETGKVLRGSNSNRGEISRNGKCDKLIRVMLFVNTLAICQLLGPIVMGSEITLDDAAIYTEILKLAEEDSKVRQPALRTLSRSRDGRLIQFFAAFNEGSVYVWEGRIAVCPKFERTVDGVEIARLFDPITGKPLVVEGKEVVVLKRNLSAISPTRQERRVVANAIRILEIWSPDTEKRLAAIKRFGESRDPEFLEPLQELIESEPSNRIKRKAYESTRLIRATGKVADQTEHDRLEAIHQLGKMGSARAVPLLQDILKNSDESKFHASTREALKQIDSYQSKVRFAQNVFNGISAGSILVLMALGLSIVFGQMGVINMAHGELMMIGAYSTYEMQLLFGHTPDNPSNVYFLASIPFAFLAAGLVGYFIEKLVVRHLYGRPLESLLATWGVGLILIQAVRVKYGDNIGVNSPTWLVGNFELVPDLVIPLNRGFIVILCTFTVVFVYWLLGYTRLGLKIRATVQIRETANTHGVNTERVDGYAFAIGSGLAGVAGCALTTIGGVTPSMGQNYIVDSFLVVVAGGVGSLWGAVLAGLGIGTLNKLLEPMIFGIAIPILATVIGWLLLSIKAFEMQRHSNLVFEESQQGVTPPGNLVVVNDGFDSSEHDQKMLINRTPKNGLIARLLAWAVKYRWGLSVFLLPIPMPLVFGAKHRKLVGVKPLVATYLIGIFWVSVAITCNSFQSQLFGELASTQVQAIWAKVFILACVIVFIQWNPLGLFRPKGRSADE